MFHNCEDQHLCKDVGMIPYLLHKNFGYESSLLTYDNGTYPRLQTEVRGLDVVMMSRTRMLNKYAPFVDTLRYVARHAKSIDILQLYHPNRNNRILAAIYKVLNPRGVAYLKLDGLKPTPMDQWVFDVITAETRYMHDELKDGSVFLLPHGVDLDSLPEPIPYADKDKLIVHSGRLGDPLKASEIVLETFASVVNEYPDWRLALVGGMPPEFEKYCQNTISKYGLDDRVIMTGYISNRGELYELYNRARVVFMPSRSESWCLALLECMALGAVPLTSDIPVFKELVGNDGVKCKIDELDCYADGLRYIIGHEYGMSIMSTRIIDHARQYDWKNIIGQLHDLLEEVA